MNRALKSPRLTDIFDRGRGCAHNPTRPAYQRRILIPLGQPLEELLLVLTEAQPQVHLELTLHRPAGRPGTLLAGELGEGKRVDLHQFFI